MLNFINNFRQIEPRLSLLAMALVVCFILPEVVVGNGISPYQVKALMVLKMQKYFSVTNAEKSVPDKKIICYYEEDAVAPVESVGQAMQQFVSNASSSQNITIKRYEAIEGFEGCNFLYIPSSAENKVTNILSSTDGIPVVTISSVKRFIYRGGMIGMVTDSQNRIKVEANLKNLQANNVTIDPQLLEIMAHVEN